MRTACKVFISVAFINFSFPEAACYFNDSLSPRCKAGHTQAFFKDLFLSVGFGFALIFQVFFTSEAEIDTYIGRASFYFVR